MKVAVIGDRNINDEDWVNYHLDMLGQSVEDVLTIISGGSKGVDTIAQVWAIQNDFDFILIKPYHMVDNKMDYSPRFFFTRNKQIIDNADYVLILGSPEESGVQHALRYCRRRDKNFTHIEYDPTEVQ